jgi:hypothetical protein
MESLEQRMLLAGDLWSSPQSNWLQDQPATTSLDASHLDSRGRSSIDSDMPLLMSLAGFAEGESSAEVGDAAFSVGLRATVQEIQRLLAAVGQTDSLTAPVPFLGRIIPQSPGGTSEVDTLSISQVLDLANRFATEVADPLAQFLDLFPQATPAQLIQQFPFLVPIGSLEAGLEGVRIEFNPRADISSPLATLLAPVLNVDGSGLVPRISSSLSNAILFSLQTSDLSFDIIRDTTDPSALGSMSVALPEFSLDLRHGDQGASTGSIAFAAGFGFLDGSVSGGQLSLDTSVRVDLAGLTELSEGGAPIPARMSLFDLQSLSASVIASALSVGIDGAGLELDLPFHFGLAGFDTAGLFPRFHLNDANPLDSLFPTLQVTVPDNAPYALAHLLGFTTITPTGLLQYLDQVGEVIDAWQSGSLLDTPIPLARGLTVGDAVGLAESYSTAVMQFLRDAQTGLPRFKSVQELINLIPAIQVYGPQQQSLRYDPESQQLFLSLNLFRQPDPIVAVADLNAFAGQANSPIASVQMTPGEFGVDNRLTLSRSVSLGLELAIDLAPTQAAPKAAPWTPMATILARKGDRSIVNDRVFENQGIANLRDGSQVTIPLGIITDTDTVHDIVQRLRVVRDGVFVLDAAFEDDRIVLIDRTSGNATFQVRTDTSDFYQRLLTSIGIERFGGPTPGPFNEYDGPSRIVSEPLSELFDPETTFLISLPRLRHFPQGQLAEPVRVYLQDGSQVLIEPGVIPGNLQVHEMLDRLQVDRDGVQVVRATLEGEHVVLHDLTSGPHVFRTEWAEVSDGSPILSRFLTLGRDVDGDGRILGPNLVPSLPNDQVSPINVDTKLATLLDRRNLSNELTFQTASNVSLRDGTTVLMTSGPIDPEMSVGDFLDRLTVHRDGQVVVEAIFEGDAIVLLDRTVGSAPFRVHDSLMNDEFFGAIFSRLGLIGVGFEGRLAGRSLSTVVLDPHAPISIYLGLDYTGYTDEPVEMEVQLSDSSRVVFLNLGTIQGNTTLTEIAERINSPGYLISYVEGGRIIIEDVFQPRNQQPMRILEFRDLLLAQLFSPGIDTDRDGRLVGNLLGSAQSGVMPQSRVAPDTLVEEFLLSRFNPEVLQSPVARLLADLRDGTQVGFEVRVSATTTLAEFARQFEVLRDGQVVLEAQLTQTSTADGATEHRFVLVDRTTPNGLGQPFRVKMDPDGVPFFDSQIPMLLGLMGIDESGTGVLLGPVLSDQLPEDRVRLMLTNPPVLYAEVSAIAANVQAEARLGELASIGIRDGHGAATASVQIEVIKPEDRDYITLTEMLDSIARPRDGLRVTVDADATFQADLYADFGTLLVPVDDPALQPRIAFAWNDAITNDPRLRLNFDTLEPPTITNFSQLIKIKELTVRDVTDLIRRLVDLVERISGEDLLGKRLPIVNTSIGEVLNTVDRVSDLVDRIVNDPQSTLKNLERDLEQALGLADHELTLSFDAELGALRMDVDLAISPVNVQQSLNIDLANAGLDGLSSLVDFQAAAEVTVTAGAELNLHVGLDLEALRTGSFDGAVLVYDSTGVNATALVRGEQMQFTTAIGPLGVGAGPGSVVLDRDGLAFGSSNNTSDPARLAVTLSSTPNGIYRWDQLSPSQFTTSFDAVVGVDLPLTFNLGSSTTQPLQIHWPDLNSTSFSQVASINPAGGNQIVLPDLSQAISSFTLLDGVHALAAGLEGLFGLIERYLGDEVLGIPVPVIGQGLSDAVDFLDRLRSELGSSIDVPGIGVATARQAIFDALGPGSSLGGGSGILGDLNGDGAITIDDVGLELNGDDEVLYRLKIAQSSVAASTSIALDVGVPGLGLVVDGNAAVQFGYSFDVGFGLSANEGPFVQFFDGDELQLDFTASVADLVAEGRLGPLFVSVATIPAARLTEQQRQASRLDPNDPATEKINAIGGRYAIDLGSGRYSLVNLGSLASLGIQTQAILAGSLHLDVDTSLGGDARLPSLATGLHLNWGSTSGSIDTVVASLARPSIEFQWLIAGFGFVCERRDRTHAGAGQRRAGSSAPDLERPHHTDSDSERSGGTTADDDRFDGDHGQRRPDGRRVRRCGFGDCESAEHTHRRWKRAVAAGQLRGCLSRRRAGGDSGRRGLRRTWQLRRISGHGGRRGTEKLPGKRAPDRSGRGACQSQVRRTDSHESFDRHWNFAGAGRAVGDLRHAAAGSRIPLQPIHSDLADLWSAVRWFGGSDGGFRVWLRHGGHS